MKSALLLSCLLGLAAADISLQLFPDCCCGSDGEAPLANIHASGSDSASSSGCQAVGSFRSANVVSVDPGFVCNVFSDAACADFVSQLTDKICTGVAGQGVICFSQTAFDNPFSQSVAKVTVGQEKVGWSNPQNIIKQAVQSACSDSGCDPKHVFQESFDRSIPNVDLSVCAAINSCPDTKPCTETVTMTGNYDSPDQRDYIASILQTALDHAKGDTSKNGDATVTEIPSFFQVVINDKNGNNQAEMTATLDVECNNADGALSCDGILGTVTTTVLGEIPEVGGIIAGLFDIACSAATSK